MPVYRPRALLSLTVPIEGTALEDGTNETVTFDVPVRRVSIESNHHNEADVADVTVDWKSAGVDVRVMSNATGVIYLGEADERGAWEPTDSDIRFIGTMKRPKRIADENGLSVELNFHDYTSFFLDTAHIFPAAGIPEYSQTLSEAWRRICDHTGLFDPASGEILPTVRALRDRLRFVGDARDLRIGSAVTQRFSNQGQLHMKPEADAWAVWQHCVAMMGFISFIRLDECIVTTATNYYSARTPPRMVYGKNILRLTEDRDPKITGAGVLIESFDPLTSTTIEAFWPPVGDATVRRKHLGAKARNNIDKVRAAESREAFAFPGITDQSALEALAKRVHEERSRQDLEGRAITHEMRVDATDESSFDLTRLASGDDIRIEIDRDDLEFLSELGSDEERISYMVGRGYDEGLSKLIARSLNGVLGLEPQFHVKRSHVTLDCTQEGGEFQIEIDYCNRILISGDAV